MERKREEEGTKKKLKFDSFEDLVYNRGKREGEFQYVYGHENVSL